MDHATRLRQIGLSVANALGEVGNQIKERAKKAGVDLTNLSESAGFICGKCSTAVQEGSCTLFVDKNDELVYEKQSNSVVTVLAGNVSSIFGRSKSTNDLILNVEDGGSAVIATTNKGPISEVYNLNSIEWYRKFSSKEPSRVPEALTERYLLSADDVGAIIIAEATIDLDGKTSVLRGEMGPFDIDVITKKKIENYLIVGAAQFHVSADNDFYVNKKSDAIAQGLSNIAPTFQSYRDTKFVLRVTTDFISSENLHTKEVITVNYESTYPLLTLDVVTPKFEICFDKKRKMSFIATNKHARDVIILTIRAFHGKKLMVNSLSSNLNEQISAQVVLGKLNTDLCNAIQASEQAKLDLEAVKREKIALETEMKETITSFQEMQMNEVEGSYKREDSGESEKLKNMLADALAENNRLDKLAQSQKMDLEEAIKEIYSLQTKLAKLASL